MVIHKNKIKFRPPPPRIGAGPARGVWCCVCVWLGHCGAGTSIPPRVVAPQHMPLPVKRGLQWHPPRRRGGVLLRASTDARLLFDVHSANDLRGSGCTSEKQPPFRSDYEYDAFATPLASPTFPPFSCAALAYDSSSAPSSSSVRRLCRCPSSRPRHSASGAPPAAYPFGTSTYRRSKPATP
jgi:hypothetical protein